MRTKEDLYGGIYDGASYHEPSGKFGNAISFNDEKSIFTENAVRQAVGYIANESGK